MHSVNAALDADHIRQAAGELAAGCEIHVLDSVASTNRWLLEHQPSARVALCIAEQQVDGKGRRGRQWSSEVASFTCSIRVSLQMEAAKVGAFSLVVALALHKAIAALGVEGVAIKWPNDLHHDWRKLSGILLEVARTQPNRIDIVCGAGVNWQPMTQNVGQPSIDVSTLHPTLEKSRNDLAGFWLAEMVASSVLFEREGFAPFVQDWNRFDALKGLEVDVLRGNNPVQGTVRGVDNDGALLLETEQGMVSCYAGEVSVRRR